MNRRDPLWQSGALPTELFPHVKRRVGLEPTKATLEGWSTTTVRSSHMSIGADRDRTCDILNANQVLSQLSYSPIIISYLILLLVEQYLKFFFECPECQRTQPRNYLPRKNSLIISILDTLIQPFSSQVPQGDESP